MPLRKLVLRPGVNKEVTRYVDEEGWADCDKIRFRAGYPEKIGGWQRISSNTFLGVARALFNWVTLEGQKLLSVGTNLKFYIEKGGAYFDVTPERTPSGVSLTDPFETVSGSTTVTVTDANGGYINGDFVTFSGASAVGGLTLNGEFQITYSTGNTYTIQSSSAASSSATGGGSVTAKYQLNVGPEFAVPLVGWGAGGWSEGTWGNGATSTDSLRLWSQSNFGEDLIFGPRGSSIYYWDATNGLTTRAVELSSLAGASNTPTKQNFILVSDVSRFVFCFGANTLGTSTQDPMLIRWSDQENAVNWTPSATNQAGDLRLSQGSEIISALQARQEILVFTDSALYALQYVGGTIVWGSQLLSTNLSIASQNAAVFSDGVTYWMGLDSFYLYDGSVKNLPCTVKRHVFSDINQEQIEQVFAGSNEGFNEIWWFYCSGTSTTVDKYVIYNYEQNIWYFGSLARSAWVDTGIRQFPVAATYSNNLVTHEDGLDNNEGSSGTAITAFITSGEFDIDDGDKFSFIRRLLPDITFEGSTAESPAATFELLPLQSSGSGRNDPLSEGGSSSGTVTRSATVPVEKYTTQVNTRVRGRQLSIKVQSDSLGVKWQLGAPRIDIRADGRR
tara:strand:- start:897 stop:2747 length:1851 start_codon:yes stop_codon:yes gene_type:complete